MTVCIAAICQEDGHQVVVGASDRMVTVGDLQYEPKRIKLVPFTNGCVALVAGDHTHLTTILRKTQRLLAEHPTESVTEIADLVGEQYAKLQRFHIERLVLHKFGLSYPRFLKTAKDLPPELLREIVAGIRDTELEAEFLVAGLQPSGQACIYKITRGIPDAYDASGFAAIGWGERVAGAQFMAWDYSRYESVGEALWLCYYAKRRAEAVPSVGARGTDLFTIRPGEGFAAIHPLSLEQTFAAAYAMVREAEEGQHRQAVKRIEEWAREVFKPRQRGAARKAARAKGPSASKPASLDPPPSPGSDALPSPES